MALLDFLKKREKGMPKKQDEEAKKKNVKGEEKSAGKKSSKTVELKYSGIAHRVLREPHVTEKSTDLTNLNQYVFRVFKSARKPEIKRSVEDVYGVHVINVSKIKVSGKERRRGRHVGWKAGYVKAVVTLKKGERIEILPH